MKSKFEQQPRSWPSIRWRRLLLCVFLWFVTRVDAGRLHAADALALRGGGSASVVPRIPSILDGGAAAINTRSIRDSKSRSGQRMVAQHRRATRRNMKRRRGARDRGRTIALANRALQQQTVSMSIVYTRGAYDVLDKCENATGKAQDENKCTNTTGTKSQGGDTPAPLKKVENDIDVKYYLDQLSDEAKNVMVYGQDDMDMLVVHDPINAEPMDAGDVVESVLAPGMTSPEGGFMKDIGQNTGDSTIKGEAKDGAQAGNGDPSQERIADGTITDEAVGLKGAEIHEQKVQGRGESNNEPNRKKKGLFRPRRKKPPDPSHGNEQTDVLAKHRGKARAKDPAIRAKRTKRKGDTEVSRGQGGAKAKRRASQKRKGRVRGSERDSRRKSKKSDKERRTE